MKKWCGLKIKYTEVDEIIQAELEKRQEKG